eukprot:scaffold14617_cov113-Skeletonema_dohrnii-CCMP3373.AAC.4
MRRTKIGSRKDTHLKSSGRLVEVEAKKRIQEYNNYLDLDGDKQKEIAKYSMEQKGNVVDVSVATMWVVDSSDTDRLSKEIG